MRRLLVLLTALLLVPASAALASGAAVIRDCTDDGRLNKRYTQRELRDALSSIPSDVDEYTNCRDTIRRAAFGGAGGGSGGSGDGDGGNAGGEFGGFGDENGAGQDPQASASPEERADLDRARREGGGGIKFSTGGVIRPGRVARRTEAGATDVPGPLLAAAILLALAALAAAAPTVRTRVLARRGA
jgi:hypothetical protein